MRTFLGIVAALLVVALALEAPRSRAAPLDPATVALLGRVAVGTSWTTTGGAGLFIASGTTTSFSVAAGSTVATAGFPIFRRGACVVSACAPSGSVVTAGAVSAFYWQGSGVGVWSRTAGGDGSFATGGRCGSLPTWQILVKSGRMDVSVQGLAFSPGSTGTATLYANCVE